MLARHDTMQEAMRAIQRSMYDVEYRRLKLPEDEEAEWMDAQSRRLRQIRELARRAD